MARQRTVAIMLAIACIALLACGACAATAEKKVKKFKSESFMHKDKAYTSHQAENGAVFYYSVESGSTSWTDPRRAVEPGADKLVIVLFMAPFVLLAIGGAGYLYYMKVYHPDKLAGPKKSKKGGAAGAAPAKRSASGATSPTKPSTPKAPVAKKD